MFPSSRYAGSVARPVATPAAVPVDAESWEPSCLEHLGVVGRDVQFRLASALHAAGDRGLRASFAPLLERLRDGALPIGALATALGVTPQAASRTARTLEELGYVTREASRHDGRSRLVTLTAEGRALLERAAETLAACEQTYALLIGRAALERILRDLEVLRYGLGLTSVSGEVADTRRPRSIGTSVLVTQYTNRHVRAALAAGGHEGLRPSHQDLLRAVGSDGGRVSEAARAMCITRQAVSAMVQDLEQLGYLRRRPDASDARAVVVTPTALGASVLTEMAAVTRLVEEQSRVALGTARWKRLGRDLRDLDEGLAATAVVGPGGPPPRRQLSGPASRPDLSRLAAWLRQRLGPADAAQLGALLAPAPGRTPRRRAGPDPVEGRPEEPGRPVPS